MINGRNGSPCSATKTQGKYLQRILTANIVDANEESFATTIHLGAEVTVDRLGAVLERPELRQRRGEEEQGVGHSPSIRNR
jgi:hypothetical protein